MKRLGLGAGAACILCSAALGADVWTSTFDMDGNPDGFVVLRDGQPLKSQLDGPSGGFLGVTNWDIDDGELPDKAGRPTGTALGGSDSFSALYEFHWSALNELNSPSATEFVGFLGDADEATRQVCGALLRHRKWNGIYFLSLDLGFGSVGNTDFGYLAGPQLSIGATDAIGKTFKLAVGYDGSTHVLSVALFDGEDGQIHGLSADLDTDMPGLQQPGTPADEIGALAVTHVGWGDYSAGEGDTPSVWQVDAVSYFDTAGGAVNAVGGPVTGEWTATFDADADGVVDLYNSNSGKVMLGPVVDGRLPVTVWDNLTNAYFPDKVGHYVGRTLRYTDAFSAFLKFRWSELYSGDRVNGWGAMNMFGFLGTHDWPQTRPVVGALLQQWKDPGTNEYKTNLGIGFGAYGLSNFGYFSQTAYPLGSPLGDVTSHGLPNIEGQDFYLAMGYEPTTTVFTVHLYDADGFLIGQNNVPLPQIPSLGFNQQAELEAMALTHVGWHDYSAASLYASADLQNVWEADEMAYFESATGGFCRVPRAPDLDLDGDVDLDDYLIFELCFGGPTQTSPPMDCAQEQYDLADLDCDSNVDLGDFGAFQERFPG
jgi:hypothetical protein